MSSTENIGTDGKIVGKYIGPHACYEIYLMFSSTWVWFGAALLAWPFAAQWVGGFEAISFIANYSFELAAYILGSALIIVGLYIAHARYVATSFVIEGPNLFISYGILNKVSNTIPLKFIFDCDTFAGPAEQSMGVKTLILRVLDSGNSPTVLYLKFIANAEDVRTFVLNNSATSQSKVYTSF